MIMVWFLILFLTQQQTSGKENKEKKKDRNERTFIVSFPHSEGGEVNKLKRKELRKKALITNLVYI